MHRCEVSVSKGELNDFGYPAQSFICGDTANRKLGKVWVCNQHWQMFADHPSVELCEAIVDAREIKSL